MSTSPTLGFSIRNEKSGQILSSQLHDLFVGGGKKPLVVIGNPGTAPDCLMAAIQDKSLVEDGLVEKMALMQPAFGSPIVDKLKQGHIFARILVLVAKLYFAVFYKNGDYEKYLTEPVRKLFEEKLSSLPSDYKNLLDTKLFYIRSTAKGKMVTPWLYLAYLMLNEGESDAVSYTSEQIIGDVGMDLTKDDLIVADHWDLNVSLPFSNTGPRYRKAFTKALLRRLSLEPD